MELSEQVCSREQAFRLKELGIIQESIFIHCKSPMKGWVVGMSNEATKLFENAAAYNVAELGLMLPEYVGEKGKEWFLEMFKDSSNLFNQEWHLVRYNEHDGIGGHKIHVGFNTSHEALSRADMVIYLLEKKLVSAEEINQRLTEPPRDVHRAYSQPVKGNVFKNKEGRKFVVLKEHLEAMKQNVYDYEFVCENPHEDGDYSYLCTNTHCRCQS